MTDQTPDNLAVLRELERKVLWLASWIIHHANHIRENVDGLKVGAHEVEVTEAAWGVADRDCAPHRHGAQRLFLHRGERVDAVRDGGEGLSEQPRVLWRHLFRRDALATAIETRRRPVRGGVESHPAAAC